jgi:hypothetical protein
MDPSDVVGYDSAVFGYVGMGMCENTIELTAATGLTELGTLFQVECDNENVVEPKLEPKTNHCESKTKVVPEPLMTLMRLP